MSRKIPYPEAEDARIAALNSYRVLDTAPEQVYDHIIALAASICETPIALISLVDTHRQWFKARVGLEVPETPREHAFCAYTVCGDRPLIVEDASADPVFKDHPLVIADPSIRFYAGVPLMTTDGLALGSLCVIDKVPRKISPESLEALSKLGQQVISLFELTKANFLAKGSAERVEELDQFFSIAADLFATIDISGNFRMVNPTMCKLLGYSEAEIVMRPYTDFLHPDDRESTATQLNSTNSGSQISGFENRYLSKDGRTIYLSWKFATNLSNGIIYAAGRDVTDIKTNEKLIEAQRAQILSASKLASLGEMAGGVAHEINTPLNAILFCTEEIQASASEIGSDSIVAMASKVSEIVRRISEIVKGLRTFARDGTLDALVETDLQVVVHDTLALSAERIRQNGVSLEFVNSVRPVMAMCRTIQLGQVILNLLNNSFDAVVGSPYPWIRVKISDLGELGRIEITDSGLGISPAISQKIFNPFFTTKDVGKGTGIGLSISKGIVESHNGLLYVDENCVNTSFIIDLPLIDVGRQRG